jgi:hypothetical protein
MKLHKIAISLSLGLALTGCFNQEKESCTQHEIELAVMKTKLELLQAQYDSNLAAAAGDRASLEYQMQLVQIDTFLRASQENIMTSVLTKLDERLGEYQKAQSNGKAEEIEKRKLELEAMQKKASQLKGELEKQKQQAKTTEVILENQRKVSQKTTRDAIGNPNNPVSTGNPSEDSEGNDPTQQMVALGALAAACTASTGGMCAVLAMNFLSSMMGEEVTTKDIETASEIFESVAEGKELTQEQQDFLSKHLGGDSPVIYNELVNILSGNKSADEAILEQAKKL